MTIEINKSLIS